MLSSIFFSMVKLSFGVRLLKQVRRYSMSVLFSLYTVRRSSTYRKYLTILKLVTGYGFWSFPGVAGRILIVWRTLVPPWLGLPIVRMFGP